MQKGTIIQGGHQVCSTCRFASPRPILGWLPSRCPTRSSTGSRYCFEGTSNPSVSTPVFSFVPLQFQQVWICLIASHICISHCAGTELAFSLSVLHSSTTSRVGDKGLFLAESELFVLQIFTCWTVLLFTKPWYKENTGRRIRELARILSKYTTNSDGAFSKHWWEHHLSLSGNMILRLQPSCYKWYGQGGCFPSLSLSALGDKTDPKHVRQQLAACYMPNVSHLGQLILLFHPWVIFWRSVLCAHFLHL